MQELYGNSVNIRHEIKLAMAWCKTNEYKKDWKKFLNNWFSTCLKRGGSVVPYEETERPEEKEEEPVQMSEEDKRLEERIAALSKDFMRAIKEGRREDANRINEEKSRLMREKFKNSKAEWEGCVYEDQ